MKHHTTRHRPILGVHASPPRVTLSAAFLVASTLSVPFAALALLEWLL